MLELLGRGLVFLGGMLLVCATLLSAIKSLVLPRSSPDWLSRFVFRYLRRLFRLGLRAVRTYSQRDRIMAYYAPVGMILLLPVWLSLVAIGYTAMFWAIGSPTLLDAFMLSGSSLLTLGFRSHGGFVFSVLEFTEATIGLMLVALLIAYLPSMYAAFSRRETAVTLLEVRAGSPPSAVEMISRFNRIHGLARLSETWQIWETWFAEVQESHTTLAALVFFRSPHPDKSWVTASGAVLDAASLVLSSVDIPYDPRAALCIRAGYLCLRQIADFFGFQHPANPHYPADPITVTREEFDAALSELAQQGVPLMADREQAWADFAGWRVNYDRVLITLADLTMAPDAPWSGTRRLPESYPLSIREGWFQSKKNNKGI
jgi:hypothetical protein